MAPGAWAAPAIWGRMAGLPDGQQDDARALPRSQPALYLSGQRRPAWSFASLPSSQGIYKSGKIRYIAVAAPKRIAQMPDVPTVAEAGGPTELDVNSFVSLLSPKGVDLNVRNKIRSDVVAVLQDPQVKEKFSTFAFQPMIFTVPEMQQFARKKSEQYKLLIDKAQISLD